MKSTKIIAAAFLLLATGGTVRSQRIPVIISGATLHAGNGVVIENAHIGFADGKIFLASHKLESMYKNARMINAQGKHVYPGIICMNTYIGLNEIDAVRATRDFNEVGEINPNVRSLIAFNTDSRVLPTLLSNGILLAQIVPQGGLVSGSSSVMKTKGWNWEDAAYKTDDGIHMNWPELLTRGVPAEKQEEVKQTMTRELQMIDELFEQAFLYSMVKDPNPVNTRFEAFRRVFSGEAKLYLHVNSARGIISSLSFIKRYPQIKAVLVGANDAYKLTELIKSSSVPVVLNTLHRLPQRASEDIDQPYKTAALLLHQGIDVAIGMSGSWESRNVMFTAGTAAAYGLTREEALSCITLNAAKILGIADKTGSIENGKDATLIISEGDILDMKSSKVEQAFIAGEEVSLDNVQKELYRKFSGKYGK